MSLISCQNASFAYENSVAVSSADFEVNTGEYLCIVGENGSGKSTLIKGLLRLKQPVSGRIVNGDGLKQSEIGYMPQQTIIQKDFPASVNEVVLSGRLGGLGLRPFYSKKDRTSAEENMKRLEIFDLRGECYRELSIGQQQRVLLARALCAARKMLVLDEPTAGLDPAASQDLYRLVSNLNRDDGVTIIMVTHDIHGALRYAGRILHLKTAQKFFGDTAEYIKSDTGVEFLKTASSESFSEGGAYA